MSEPMAEIAKAVQKAADLGANSLDLVKRAGGYVEKMLGPSLQNLADIGRDRTALWKLQNFVAVAERAEGLLNERGLGSAAAPLSARLGVPLIEAAATENDPAIQDLWARYLAKGLSAPGGGFVTRHLTGVLSSLEPDDAKLLEFLFGVQRQSRSGTVTFELSDVLVATGFDEFRATSCLDRLSSLGVLDRDTQPGHLLLESDDEHVAEFSVFIRGVQANYTIKHLLRQLSDALLL